MEVLTFHSSCVMFHGSLLIQTSRAYDKCWSMTYLFHCSYLIVKQAIMQVQPFFPFKLQLWKLSYFISWQVGLWVVCFELCLLFRVPNEILLHPPLWASGTILIVCILLYLWNCTDAACWSIILTWRDWHGKGQIPEFLPEGGICDERSGTGLGFATCTYVGFSLLSFLFHQCSMFILLSPTL